MEITRTAVLLVLALGKHIARYPHILQVVDHGEANLLEASRRKLQGSLVTFKAYTA